MTDMHPPPDRGVYAISVAAQIVGIGIQNLRAYERRGLVDPTRTAGGTRLYSANDIDRLRRITELLALGLNLAGVAMVLELEEDNERLRQRLDGGEMTPQSPDGIPALRELADRLRQAGCVFAEEEAELLLGAAGDPDELAAMVARRATGVPLEQVVGWAEFCGLRILLDPGVFVPRRRTEFLVRQATALAPRHPVVVDLCCGSGAVGAALRAALDDVDLYAVDVDPAAVRCARRNLSPDRVLEGDLFAPLPARLRGRVDLLVVNAPYVPADELHLMPAEARVHEPRTALDGGADGLDVHRRVASEARQWLAPHGHLLIETSARQAATASGLFTDAGLSARVRRCTDLEVTVVVGTAPGPVALPDADT